MNASELTAVWESIAPPAVGTLAGRPVPGPSPAAGVRLATDHGGLWHLLLPSQLDNTLPEHSVTKGLEVVLAELQVGKEASDHYFDVGCRDATLHLVFATVAAEILGALAEDPHHPRSVLGRVLRRWRFFWAAPPRGLTDEEIIGLFGELWFLEYWLGPITADSLAAWQGPLGDRHDFKSAEVSVEVKATRARADGAARHRITHLDQLADPEQGQLHLFSLQVTPDPIATHSLATTVERITASLSSAPDELRTFEKLLGGAGYSPAHRHRYVAPVRVTAEELYAVARDFPRLTRDSFDEGVPSGVGDISYTLDLAACRPWRVAVNSREALAQTVRDALR